MMSTPTLISYATIVAKSRVSLEVVPCKVDTGPWSASVMSAQVQLRGECPDCFTTDSLSTPIQLAGSPPRKKPRPTPDHRSSNSSNYQAHDGR